MNDIYHFLTVSIPQLHYLAAVLILGLWLVRQPKPNLSLAGTLLLCLAVPLAGTSGAFEELAMVPFVVLRYLRVALFHIWPAAAYGTLNLEWSALIAGAAYVGSSMHYWESRVIGGVASFNAALATLVIATSLFVRARIPAATQQRTRGWIPMSWSPLWSNPWPTPGGQRIWDINLCIIALCLLPVIVVGPLAAIYLRLRASHLLWPATWIVALWSLSRLVGGGARWLLLRFMDSRTALQAWESVAPTTADLALIKKVVGFSFFYDMPVLMAAAACALACGLTLPLVQRRQRDWRWLGALLFCGVCFQMLWGGWLPDMIGRAPVQRPTHFDLQKLLDQN